MLAAAAAELLCHLADPRVAESSSLVSTPSGDWLWTANDSGDSARVFAVGRDGRTLAVAALPRTTVTDVEDAALGPGRTLYLADTGDNSGRRTSVSLLRVPEPEVDPARAGARLTAATPQRTVLTYEDGPHDAETLLVQPRTGQVLVVTKGVLSADVYAAPQPLADGVLHRVGSLPLRATGTPGGPGRIGAFAQVLATGGSVSPDGRRLVVRTYTDAYVWEVPGDDLLAAFARPPTVLPLPETEQGEAVTWSQDGRSLLTSSEGAGAPVWQVAAPPVPATAAPSRAPATSAGPARPAAQAPGSRPADRLPGGRGVLVAAGVLVACVTGLGLSRRRRRG